MLDVDEQTRLGNMGPDSIKTHPWFDGIDWKGMENHSFPVPKEIMSRIAQHLEMYSEDITFPRLSLSQDVEDGDVPEWLDDW